MKRTIHGAFFLGLALFAAAVLVAPSADTIRIRGHVSPELSGRLASVQLSLVDTTDQTTLGPALLQGSLWSYALASDLHAGPYTVEATALSESGVAVARVARPFVVGVARDEPLIRIDIVRPNGRDLLRIEGWAIDRDSTSGTGVSKIELFLDAPPPEGGRLPDPHIGNERADVARSFAGEGFRFSGWWIDLETRPLPSGPHRVFAAATSAVTSQVAVAETPIDVTDGGPRTGDSPARIAPLAFDEPAPFAVTFASASTKGAAIVSTFVMIASVAVIILFGSRTLLLLSLVVFGAVAACGAFLFVDPGTIRSEPATTVAAHLPHLERTLSLAILGSHGIVGTVPPAGIALAVLPVIIVAIALGMYGWPARESLIFLVIGGLLTLLLIASGSRGAAIALASGLAVLGFARRRKVTHAALVLVFTCLAVLLAAIVVDEAYVPPGRLELWYRGLVLLKEELWPGIGRFGQLGYAAHTTHNTLLQMLIDFGPVGLAGLALMVGASLLRAVRLIQDTDNSGAGARLRATITLGVLGALVVAGVTESLVSVPVAFDNALLTFVVPTPFFMAALPFARE